MDGGASKAAVHGVAKSDMTERLHFHLSLSCTGEGNGNPLQCSCLEDPRDGGAWWAAIYGVAQSQTRLNWLSNSNTHSNCILYDHAQQGKKKKESLSLYNVLDRVMKWLNLGPWEGNILLLDVMKWKVCINHYFCIMSHDDCLEIKQVCDS